MAKAVEKTEVPKVVDRKVPYLILLIHNEDGELCAGQFQLRHIVEVDGARLKNEPLAAEPIAVAKGEHGKALDAVLGSELTAALVRLDMIEAENAAMRAALEAADAEKAEIVAVKDEVEQKLQSVMGDITVIEGASKRATKIRVE